MRHPHLQNPQIGRVTADVPKVSDAAPSSDADRRLRTDDLTQLASKYQLFQWLDECERGLLALFDVDDFRVLNHSLGHDFGDAALQLLARRLESANSGPDRYVARLGQDEFAVLALGSVSPAELSEQLRSLLREPFRLGGRLVRLRATHGIARCAGTKAPNDVIREADTAMYEAKSHARGNGLVFDDAFQERAMRSLELAEGLRHAVDQGDLAVHYQPQVDLGSGRIVAVEALVRWWHPTIGSVPPASFIPLAEASGLVGDIGAFVLHEAVAQRSAWAAEGLVHPHFAVGVNVSPRQLEEDGFVGSVHDALELHGCPSWGLCLEVTEGAIMADPTAAAARLTELSELGVHISVDDFGTGHSAFAYLLELPISQLKVDRSFVSQAHEPRGRTLVSAVLGLARSLGLESVAEGIETDLHRVVLRDLGCDVGQGYLFGRPAPAEEVTETLRVAAVDLDATASAPGTRWTKSPASSRARSPLASATVRRAAPCF